MGRVQVQVILWATQEREERKYMSSGIKMVRILFITHTLPEHWLNDYGWVYRARLLMRLGAEIRYIGKKEWVDMLKIYHEFKPEIIITIGPIGVVPIILKRLKLMRVPIVFDWNEEYPEIMSRYPGIRWAQSFLVKNADHITTPSMSRETRAINVYGRSPNEVHRWQQTTGKYTEDKADLEGEEVIVYVGEQSETKGTDELIKIARFTPNTNYYLVGKPNEEYVEDAPNNVVFVGRVPHDKVYEYINAADICLIGQDNDSSIKLHEYLRAGKKVRSLVKNPKRLKTMSKYIYMHMEHPSVEKESLEIKPDEEVMRDYLEFIERCVE